VCIEQNPETTDRILTLLSHLMRTLTAWRKLSNCFLLLMILPACDGTQSVSLTAEDFRFTPDLVRVNGGVPLTLSIYNAGREIHEFDSPLLVYAPGGLTPKTDKSAPANGILLLPGQTVSVALAPPPGTYLYICRRKGHANMTGTLIVE
jgi:plastocyanin